jgi:hypothetical protein
VHAATAEEARVAACRLVLEELAETGTRNPLNVPVQIKIEEVAALSWVESLRHPSPGRGFTFFPDDAN